MQPTIWTPDQGLPDGAGELSALADIRDGSRLAVARNKTTFATAANITASEPAGAAQDDILIAFLYIESDDRGHGAGQLVECVQRHDDAVGVQYRVESLPHCRLLDSTGQFRAGAAMDVRVVGPDDLRRRYSRAPGVRRSVFVRRHRSATPRRQTYPDCSGTTTDANEMLVWSGGTFANPTSSTQPTGYTERQDTRRLGLVLRRSRFKPRRVP
jgi:hypothetical protein